MARGNVLRLFRGIGAPMANQIIMNSVMFTVFNNVKDTANQSKYLDANSAAFAAGLFSGFATACLSTPMDWLKIQAQITLSDSKQSTRYNILSILRQSAVKDGKVDIPFLTRTLYSGHIANLMREGVFTMVYLGLYDRISEVVRYRRNLGSHEPIEMKFVILISSFTGACAWLCNYPFDTVKTVMQAGHRHVTLRNAIQTIHDDGGWKAFWRGAGPSTFRAMLVTSSRMLAFEKTIQLLER